MESTNQQEHSKGNESIQVVLFELSNEEFGIDINSVLEIIKVPTYTKVPNSDSFIEGIINLRGKIIAVLDLNKKLGFPKKEDDKEARVIVAEVNDEYVGLRVDMVKEVETFNKETVKPAPNLITKKLDREFIDGVVTQEENITIIINVEKIISAEDAKSISSAVKSAESGKTEKPPQKEEQKNAGEQEQKASEAKKEEPKENAEEQKTPPTEGGEQQATQEQPKEEGNEAAQSSQGAPQNSKEETTEQQSPKKESTADDSGTSGENPSKEEEEKQPTQKTT